MVTGQVLPSLGNQLTLSLAFLTEPGSVSVSCACKWKDAADSGKNFLCRPQLLFGILWPGQTSKWDQFYNSVDRKKIDEGHLEKRLACVGHFNQRLAEAVNSSADLLCDTLNSTK